MTDTLAAELELEATPAPRRSLRPVRRIGLKLLGSVFVLWAAATFTFALQALLPGDRATLLLNLQTGQTIKRTAAELAPVNAQFGFDDPVFVQYLHYVGGLARGDLGTSYQMHQPVTELIIEQISPTIALTVSALLVAWLLAVGWTVATARRGPLLSGLGSAVETVTAGLPHYWLGVILLVVFAVDPAVVPGQRRGRAVGAGAARPHPRRSRWPASSARSPATSSSGCSTSRSSPRPGPAGWATWPSGCGTRCATRSFRRSRCPAGRSARCSPAR